MTLRRVSKSSLEFFINALREKGSLYVKNFNISQGTVDRQLAIGRVFYELPLEEKLKYVPESLGMVMSLL
jgi:isopenicillin N synthase-like dioxygenase